MADSKFFKNSGPWPLEDISALTGAVITAANKERQIFLDVAPLETATAEHISFLDNAKYIEAFEKSDAGACFVRAQYVKRAPKNMTLLITEQPYSAFALTSRKFYPDPEWSATIAHNAVIDGSATLGSGVRIDAGAVIGKNVHIGNHTWIGANTIIGDGVEIGSECRIGALCTLSHAVLGKRIIIHRSVHIGQDGFGFAPSPNSITKVPQLGRVIIGDDVEIGSGTCIDRGAGPDTSIGDSSKIDNLVQIGHNVRIGKYVMVAAQTGIAGSTTIDDGVMLGGQVGIAGHVHIGKGAKIAAQAGIMTDIPAGAAYGGSPAVPIKDWHRQTIAVAKLVKKKEGNMEG